MTNIFKSISVILVLLVVVSGCVIGGMYFSYNNTDARLRAQAEATE